MSTAAGSTWLRVSRRRRCPVCGRPDWCSIAADGTAAICPRTPSALGWKGSEGGGYLHKLDGSPLPAPVAHHKVEAEPSLSAAEIELLARQYRTALSARRVDLLSAALGVTAASLRRLGAGWSAAKEAYTFPMSDAFGRVRGFRLRFQNGRKLSVKGGREGLFLPERLHWAGQPLLACEGPTSCAALLDMGFDAVGRPSCSGGVEMLVAYLTHGPRRDVVVLGDHDEAHSRPDGSVFHPGQDGAERLADRLNAARVAKTVKVLVPPFCKDAREWLHAGATRAVVESLIKALPYWRRAA